MRDRVLILIPSPLVLPYSYKFLRKHFEAKFTLLIPRVPESALSFSQKKRWSEHEYALWLKEYLEENKLQNFYLLGHSNSGAIALWFAKLYPERLQGIILADSIGVKKAKLLPTLWGRLLDAVIEWKLTLWGFHHLLCNLLLHPLNFLFQIRESIRTDILVVASSVSVPTLILWGKRDHTIPLARGKELHRAIKESRLYVSEKGSHDWIITRATEAVEVISEWAEEMNSSADDYYSL